MSTSGKPSAAKTGVDIKVKTPAKIDDTIWDMIDDWKDKPEEVRDPPVYQCLDIRR